jgi:zinc transport system ATP-binding protein
MSQLKIKDLTYAYHNKENVLENINLTIEDKDFIAIIGPNGGGKSTLLKLILGINDIQKGTIEKISNIGYVPQNTNINTSFPIKVIEVVVMGHIKDKRALFGYTKSEIACAMDALRQVGMEEYSNTKIGSLSGGQRQRVMIARALCSHPKILLLDEPTSSIDVEGQKQIYKLLKELNKYITIVVVSHDISIILGFATKVAHVNKKLTFHNIDTKKQFNVKDEHFCEVELLQMLNNDTNKGCGC